MPPFLKLRRKRRSWRRSTGDGDTLHFFYDANGKRTTLDYNGETYAYFYNAQGDVVALSDANGAVVVEYAYDAWGNPLSITGAGATTIVQKNPFRYRGYFYDTETGLYYLQSRYYSPKIGRFVCADDALGQIGNIHTGSMFAYAFNNPVSNEDPNGNWPRASKIFAALAVAAAVVAVTAIVVATAGAAAPAMAAVGGGVIAGTSAGAAAATATAAAAAAVVFATASRASRSAEATRTRSSRRNQSGNNHTVYVLKAGETVEYVGRTINPQTREKAHRANPYRASLSFVVYKDGLTYEQARGLEQILMLQHHTINTANRMNNQINGISPHNPNLGYYMQAARGIIDYAENKFTNEILYWTGN